MKKNIHFTRSLAIVVLTIFILIPGLGWGQNYQSFDASSANAFTASTWSSPSTSNACVSTGLTNAFTPGSIVYLCTPNGTGSGAVGISIGGVIATENYTHSSTSGTLATGGGIVTIDVATGKTFDLSAAISTVPGTGFIKAGAGVFALRVGGSYPGGFTLNTGTFIVGGVNTVGNGVLTINSGVFAANANRDLSSKPSSIVIGGDFTLGATTGLALSTANLTFNSPTSLGTSTARTITLGGTGTYSLNGVISGPNSSLTLAATAAGTLSLGGANTYDGGTIITGGTLLLGASGVLADVGAVTLDGGTLKTGATTGNSETMGTLALSSNSTIAFGTGVHALNFAASNGISWSGTTLTITGWTGTAGTSGTAGKIFVGSDATGLTSEQLAKINFTGGFSSGAKILSNGEIVPISVAPILTADATNNDVDHTIDITFTDNASWRAAITAVKIGGTALTEATDYVLSAGNLQLIPSGGNALLQTAGSKAVTVEATGYTTASVTQQINVGAAAKLAMKTQPTAPAANGAVLATQPAAYIQDQYGNTTASTADVTATVGSGTWTLGGGSTTVAGVNGTVTYSGLTATSVAAVTGANIAFTSTGLTGITSGEFNIPAKTPPTLTADATNNDVDNNIDITFTDDAAWRAAITAVKIGGTALTAGTDFYLSVGNLQLKPSGLNSLLTTTGSKAVTVQANGYLDASVTQQINVGAAAKLSMKTQPTAPISNGVVLAVQPEVDIQDQYGNSTTSTVDVTATVGSGTWTLGGGSTTVTGVNGTVTYSGLTATSVAAVTGATIAFTSTGLTGITSGEFNIPAKTPPTLTADATNNDVDNNIDIEFTDDATWRIAVTDVKIGGTALTTGTDYDLTAGNLQLKPSGLNVLLTTSGSKSVTVVATGYIDGSITQQINAGSATKLGMKTQPAAPATNGAVLATQPEIYIQDQYGNTTTSTADVIATVGLGAWTLGGVSTTVAGVNGTVTYSGLTATSVAAVTGATISFTSDLLTGVSSGLFDIPEPLPPTITTNISSLTGFTYALGSGPSAEQTFTVSGTDLTDDISIAAATDYEISLTSGSGYTTPLTLAQSGGTVAATTIYVRLKSGLIAGDYNTENIAVTSGALVQNVTCSGSVTPALWVTLLTSGQPAATRYLGDKLNASTWYINFEIGQATWNQSDAGIGKSNTDPSAWTWRTASWYEDNGTNRRVRSDFGDFQFTSTGPWYFNGRVKNASADPYNYANTVDPTWSNTTAFAPTEYFTVNTLTDPSTQTATAFSASQIDLSWAQDATLHLVMIVRKKSTDSWTEPTQGVAYSVTDPIGAGVVVQNGVGTSLNNTGLDAGTTYDYKFYSENYSYYSLGVTASATTEYITPTITSFTPGSGCDGSGTSVVITGTDFKDVSAVKFNGADATSFTVDGLTQITAILPTGATTGTISVTTPGGTATSIDDFTVNELPALFAVTGGGSYCSTGTGVSVGLENSETGVNYQLYLGVAPVGSPVAGTTASAIDFGLQTASGTYTVVATNTTTLCTLPMSGSVIVTAVAPPTSYAGGPTGIAKLNTPYLLSNSSATNYTSLTWSIGNPLKGYFDGGLATSTILHPKFTGVLLDATAVLTLKASNGVCPDATATIEVYISNVTDQLTWNGNTSSDWNTTANWTGGSSVPALTSDVFIPDVTTDPIISSSAVCNNLTIQPGAVLTIAPNHSLSVGGTLTNNAGNSGLVIQSDATGTGSLLQYSSGVGATVERYITGGWIPWDAGWHIISSPVASQSITSFATGNYDFYGWDEPSNQWMNFKDGGFSSWNGGTNYNIGQGYLISYETTQTGTFSGTLNVGSITKNNLSLSSGANYSWHLLGNPFSSAISWNDGNWALSHVAGTAKIWSEGGKSYSDINSGGIIPSAQGFMVSVNIGSNSVTIPAGARTNSSHAWYKSSERQHIMLLASEQDDRSYQECNIIINSSATPGFDFEYDSRFLAGYAPQFYSVSDNEKLSTNSMPAIKDSDIIPFGFIKNEAGSFKIELKAATTPNLVVYLTDLKTNTTQNLSENPVYNFTSSTGDDPARFELSFLDVTSVPDQTQRESFGVYQENSSIRITTQSGVNADIRVVNMLGQVVLRGKTNGNSLTTLNANALQNGVYVVSLVGNGKVVSKKVVVSR